MPFATERKDITYSSQKYINITGEFAGRGKDVFATPAFQLYADARSRNEAYFAVIKSFTEEKLAAADKKTASGVYLPKSGTRKIENMTDTFASAIHTNKKTKQNEACFTHKIETPCGSLTTEQKCYPRKQFDFMHAKSPDSSHLPLYGIILAGVVAAVIVIKKIQNYFGPSA